MKSYILIVDISGFSNIVKNLTPYALTKRIKEWVEIVEKLAEKHKLVKYQTISDTLFVTTTELKDLVIFSKDLLQQTINSSLLIRGAISYGDINWERMIYGKPVIASHELEQNQDWLGITLDSSIPISETDKLYQEKLIISYIVPLKMGLYTPYPTIVWKIPNTFTLIKLFTSKGLTQKKDCLDWKIMRKINNTILFSEYCKYANKNKLPYNSYKKAKCPISFLIEEE